MALLKLFNASTATANSPKDDAGGFNAQLESKGRDQSPSPPKDDVDVGSTEATRRGSSSASFLPSKAVLSLACLGMLVLALYVAGGVGIVKYNTAPASAVGRILQQETLFVANNRGMKKANNKKSSFAFVCDSPVKCGHKVTGTGEKLSLLEDVVCTEGPDDEDDCAITVSGEGAELDCNNFMINQKEISGSFSWKYGICLTNRAKAKNCHVGGFGVASVGAGIRIEDGGAVEDSEVMFNFAHGILVEGSEDSTATTKISDTFIHNNHYNGIEFIGWDRSESSIQIEGVRSINNGSNGMELALEGATMNLRVKDSETSYNAVDGVAIGGRGANGNGYFDFELEGFFNSRYNEGNGMYFLNISPLGGEMKVKGVVNLYKNKYYGLYMRRATAVNVVVDKRGALNSCSNDQDGNDWEDIFIYGDSGTFSGDGYTCGTEGGNPGTGGPSGANLPVCEYCPSCPSE